MIRLSSSPKRNHSRFGSASNFGTASVTSANAAATSSDHQRTAPPERSGHTAMTRKTAVNTQPKLRLLEASTSWVLEKSSCVGIESGSSSQVQHVEVSTKCWSLCRKRRAQRDRLQGWPPCRSFRDTGMRTDWRRPLSNEDLRRRRVAEKRRGARGEAIGARLEHGDKVTDLG